MVGLTDSAGAGRTTDIGEERQARQEPGRTSVSTPTDVLTKYPAAAALMARGQLSANATETERIFGFGHQTMRRWRKLGTGPRYCKPIKGGRVFYLLADVIAWLEANSYGSRAEEVARG